MEVKQIPADLLDHLRIGVSLVTWHPEDHTQSAWVYVNETRCRMVGLSREELLRKPPIASLSRESRAQLKAVNAHFTVHKRLTAESMLLHKSDEAIPVLVHMTLFEDVKENLMLTQYQDISFFKKTEDELQRVNDRMRNVVSLFSEEKRQITENITGNIGLVAMPLIDQLKKSATDAQKELLGVLENRIRHVTRKLGVASEAVLPGGGLTRRQSLICEMIRDGMASKEIATALGCSPSTINNHREAIRRKLGLSGKSANLQAHLGRTGAGEATADSALDDLGIERLL